MLLGRGICVLASIQGAGKCIEHVHHWTQYPTPWPNFALLVPLDLVVYGGVMHYVSVVGFSVGVA